MLERNSKLAAELQIHLNLNMTDLSKQIISPLLTISSSCFTLAGPTSAWTGGYRRTDA